jgi:hypothetical protein
VKTSGINILLEGLTWRRTLEDPSPSCSVQEGSWRRAYRLQADEDASIIAAKNIKKQTGG